MRNRDTAAKIVTVPDIASLPLTGVEGQIFIVKNDGSGVSAVYFWDSIGVVWVSSGSSSAAWTTVKDDEVPIATPAISWDTEIDGDAAGIFRFTYHIIGSFALAILNFNNDLAANYTRHLIMANNVTPAANNNITESNLVLGAGVGAAGQFLIFAKKGKKRILIGQYSYNLGLSTAVTATVTGTWGNTVDNIDRIDIAVTTNDIEAKSKLVLEKFTG